MQGWAMAPCKGTHLLPHPCLGQGLLLALTPQAETGHLFRQGDCGEALRPPGTGHGDAGGAVPNHHARQLHPGEPLTPSSHHRFEWEGYSGLCLHHLQAG